MLRVVCQSGVGLKRCFVFSQLAAFTTPFMICRRCSSSVSSNNASLSVKNRKSESSRQSRSDGWDDAKPLFAAKVHLPFNKPYRRLLSADHGRLLVEIQQKHRVRAFVVSSDAVEKVVRNQPEKSWNLHPDGGGHIVIDGCDEWSVQQAAKDLRRFIDTVYVHRCRDLNEFFVICGNQSSTLRWIQSQAGVTINMFRRDPKLSSSMEKSGNYYYYNHHDSLRLINDENQCDDQFREQLEKDIQDSEGLLNNYKYSNDRLNELRDDLGVYISGFDPFIHESSDYHRRRPFSKENSEFVSSKMMSEMDIRKEEKRRVDLAVCLIKEMVEPSTFEFDARIAPLILRNCKWFNEKFDVLLRYDPSQFPGGSVSKSNEKFNKENEQQRQTCTLDVYGIHTNKMECLEALSRFVGEQVSILTVLDDDNDDDSDGDDTDTSVRRRSNALCNMIVGPKAHHLLQFQKDQTLRILKEEFSDLKQRQRVWSQIQRQSGSPLVICNTVGRYSNDLLLSLNQSSMSVLIREKKRMNEIQPLKKQQSDFTICFDAIEFERRLLDQVRLEMILAIKKVKKEMRMIPLTKPQFQRLMTTEFGRWRRNRFQNKVCSFVFDDYTKRVMDHTHTRSPSPLSSSLLNNNDGCFEDRSCLYYWFHGGTGLSSSMNDSVSLMDHIDDHNMRVMDEMRGTPTKSSSLSHHSSNNGHELDLASLLKQMKRVFQCINRVKNEHYELLSVRQGFFGALIGHEGRHFADMKRQVLQEYRQSSSLNDNQSDDCGNNNNDSKRMMMKWKPEITVFPDESTRNMNESEDSEITTNTVQNVWVFGSNIKLARMMKRLMHERMTDMGWVIDLSHIRSDMTMKSTIQNNNNNNNDSVFFVGELDTQTNKTGATIGCTQSQRMVQAKSEARSVFRVNLAALVKDVFSAKHYGSLMMNGSLLFVIGTPLQIAKIKHRLRKQFESWAQHHSDEVSEEKMRMFQKVLMDDRNMTVNRSMSLVSNMQENEQCSVDVNSDHLIAPIPHRRKNSHRKHPGKTHYSRKTTDHINTKFRTSNFL